MIVAAPSVPPAKVAAEAVEVETPTLSNCSGSWPGSCRIRRLVEALEPGPTFAESTLPVVPVYFAVSVSVVAEEVATTSLDGPRRSSLP